MYCEENPVDGAMLASRRRSSMTFLYAVALKLSRPLNAVMSKPPSVSVAVSGLIPGKPLIVEARRPDWPSSKSVVRNVNFPASGWLPAFPYAARSLSSLTCDGSHGRRYDAEYFGYVYNFLESPLLLVR